MCIDQLININFYKQLFIKTILKNDTITGKPILDYY